MRLVFAGMPSMDIPIETEIDAAAQAGFTGLDLWAPKLDSYLDTYPVVLLEARLRKRNLHMVALRGIESALLQSKAEKAVLEARFLGTCTRLDAMGGGLIVASPASVMESGVGDSDILDSTARTLRDLADLAAPFEVRIAFEFRGGRYSPVRSLAQSQEIVEQVARPNVGLALSTHEFHLGGGELDEIDRVDVPKLWLVHLADAEGPPVELSAEGNRTLIGEGAVPVREICARLTSRGFRGPYSIGMPSWQRPLAETAQYARQAVLGLLAPLGSTETETASEI